MSKLLIRLGRWLILGSKRLEGVEKDWTNTRVIVVSISTFSALATMLLFMAYGLVPKSFCIRFLVVLPGWIFSIATVFLLVFFLGGHFVWWVYKMIMAYCR